MSKGAPAQALTDIEDENGSKLLDLTISRSDLRTLKFSEVVMPAFTVEEKVNCYFLNALIGKFKKDHAEEYGKSRAEYPPEEMKERTKTTRKELGNLLNILEDLTEMSTSRLISWPDLKKILHVLVSDERFEALRRSAFEEAKAEIQNLASSEGEAEQALKHMEERFWNGKLFADRGYQREMIRLYVDIILDQYLW